MKFVHLDANWLVSIVFNHVFSEKAGIYDVCVSSVDTAVKPKFANKLRIFDACMHAKVDTRVCGANDVHRL